MAYNPKDKNPSGVVLFGNNGSDQVFESVTDFVYDTGNTRLGINTSSPQYTLDVSGTGTFHTIRFADGTEMITSGGGGGGGMTSWDLSVTGDSTTISDGETVTFTGQGSITTTRNANTVIISGAAGGGGMTSWTIADGSGNSEAIGNADTLYISGAGSVVTDYDTATNIMTVSGTAGGGGGTPGGSVNQIQINDGAGGFTAAGNSDRFIYNTSTNTLDIGRQSIDDTSGAQVTNYWYTNNFAIGGNNFINMNTASADFNTAVGISALQDITEGDRNVAIGYFAGDDITLGDDNICIGYIAGETMSTASDNVLIGSFAGSDFSTSLFNGNVAIGTNAMRTASTSSILRNVFIGTDAGYDADKVSDNVAIGFKAFYSSSFSTDAVHNIYIGDECPNSTLDANGTGNLIIRSVGGYGTLSQFRGQGNNELCIGNIYAGNQATQRAGIGDVNTIGDSPDAALHIQPINSSDLVLKVQGAAAQSANLQEWKDSSDTELASVGPSGRLYYQSSYSPISNEGTASSFTFDLDTSNVFSGTLSAASTLTTSNGDVGQRFLVRLKQGSGGSKTVSSWFGNRVSWPGGSAPTLSSTAGHVDLFGFLVTSGTAPTLYYDGFTIATGIQ